MLVLVQFVFTLALMISAGGLLYISVKGLSRLEEEMVFIPERATLWKRLTSAGFLEKLDTTLIRLAHRFLRRTHVLLLRLDNTLTIWLKKTRLKSDEEGVVTQFKEMTGLASQSPRRGDLLSDIRDVDSL